MHESVKTPPERGLQAASTLALAAMPFGKNSF
jgi:hypothetical protein